TVTVSLDTSQGLAIDGWQYGLCHDSQVATLLTVGTGFTTLTVNSGGMAGFYGLEMHGNGYTVGVLIDLMATNQLAPGNNYPLDMPVYEGNAPGSTGLNFCDNLNSPPVLTSVISGGLYWLPTFSPGEINVLGGFVRGDCNDDGTLNVADAVSGLNVLFGGTGQVAPCVDACDTNDDGSFNIADMITLLVHLFSSGASPAAPFPSCGVDPSADLLTCNTYTNCP
ncbi:MAG: hypothetical protein AAF581_15075, partial [Planctomycetota bacterium]